MNEAAQARKADVTGVLILSLEQQGIVEVLYTTVALSTPIGPALIF